jgi:hypothetical protein
VVLILNFLKAISEPSFRISSKFISILGFQDFPWKSQRWLNIRIIVLELSLKFIVLLLCVPVPLVYLLELEATVFCQLFKLSFGRFSLGIFI